MLRIRPTPSVLSRILSKSIRNVGNEKAENSFYVRLILRKFEISDLVRDIVGTVVVQNYFPPGTRFLFRF